MRVTGWTDWQFPEENSKYKKIPNNLYNDARNAVIEEIRKQKYDFCGDMHQNHDYCVPVLNDKWVLQCSQREWGGIMAEAHDNYDPFGYVQWYVTISESPAAKYPTPEEYKN